MHTEIKAVHFELNDATKEIITERVERLDFAADKIIDLDFTLTQDKSNRYEIEAKVHFRWGAHAVLKADGYDLGATLHDLLDRVDHKVRKEVDRVSDHKA